LFIRNKQKLILYNFRCKLCNQELLFSMCSIGEHLRIKHNISTVTQYRWEHCVQHKVDRQVVFIFPFVYFVFSPFLFYKISYFFLFSSVHFLNWNFSEAIFHFPIVHKPSLDTSKQTERQIKYYIEIENVSQIFTLPLTFFPLVKKSLFIY